MGAKSEKRIIFESRISQMIQKNLKDVHGIEMFFYLVHNCIKKETRY